MRVNCPRLFGKTLTMSTVDYFFSKNHADGRELFERFFWKKYHNLQGIYRVISISFAAMDEYGLTTKDEMKCFYHGFVHGQKEARGNLKERSCPDRGKGSMIRN
jgi:hypothetical protein